MFDKKYYDQKQQKLQEKLAKIKDQYIVDIGNMTQRLFNEINEIRNDNAEIEKVIKENKTIKKK